jgi:hypothetical protein
MKKLDFLRSFSLIDTFLFLVFNLALINAQTKIHRDSVIYFLTDYSGKLDVAKVPPAIDFGIIDIGKADPDYPYTHWGNIVLGPNDKFYYAIGDHNPSGIVILKSYDPKTKTDEICIYSPDVPGLADGKWHGRPVINPSTGDMYLIGFYQGQVVRYNIYSKNVTNYGPVGGNGWEEHIWDYQRNRLYGVGSHGEVLVYNTENNSMVFSGKPFQDLYTDPRARMVDFETGIFYATADFGKLYKYNPDSNVFTKLRSNLPADLRANTNKKEADGSFWISDRQGNLFKFFPEKDLLTPYGVNSETGEYVTFMERSPYGNYLYYIAATGGNNLIQYNTNTNEKKVIADLSGYYSEKYKYLISGFYGGALSRNGSSIFLVCNGFVNSKERPAMFHVHIPQSEKDMETFIERNTAIISEISAYPNPFKHITTVSFHINKPGDVSLTIMDITGKTIHALHNGYLQVGSHQFEWNIDEAKKLSRGIYFYSLQLNNERVVKKLVVLQ